MFLYCLLLLLLINLCCGEEEDKAVVVERWLSQAKPPPHVRPLNGLSPAPSDQIKESHHWRRRAIERLWDERREMKHTPVVIFNHLKNVLIVFKNETASRTQSLKHRYVWALFLWAILEGHIGPDTTVYEASSGNTAYAEAFFCRLIGSKFVAIVPDITEQQKIDNIEGEGGRVIKVPPHLIINRAREEAANDEDGYFMNQFANSDLAEEYHTSGNATLESTNLFYELHSQLVPYNLTPVDHVILSAGTGGTLSSVGRYIKKYSMPTEVILADSEFSVYYDLVMNGRFGGGNGSDIGGGRAHWIPPGIAGTGFGSQGPAIKGKTSSLLPSVIDRAIKVPDLASIAGMLILKERYGINGGPSTGLNFVAALRVVGTTFRDPKFKWTRRQQEREGGGSGGNEYGSYSTVIATMICDNSYTTTYYNMSWVEEKFKPHGGVEILECWRTVIDSFLDAQPDNIGVIDPITVGSEKCKFNWSDNVEEEEKEEESGGDGE